MISVIFASMLTITSMNTMAEAEEFCEVLEPQQVVAVDSNGGNLFAFMKAGDCINEKEVNLVIWKALSAAGYMASSAKQACIFEESVIGYHSPYRVIGEVKMDMTVPEYRNLLMYIGSKLQSWGIDPVTTMRIIYTTLDTPSESLFLLEGKDTSRVLQNVFMCEDALVEGE